MATGIATVVEAQRRVPLAVTRDAAGKIAGVVPVEEPLTEAPT